jgi:hypothetical protein
MFSENHSLTVMEVGKCIKSNKGSPAFIGCKTEISEGSRQGAVASLLIILLSFYGLELHDF